MTDRSSLGLVANIRFIKLFATTFQGMLLGGDKTFSWLRSAIEKVSAYRWWLE
jgi:hypothetical protein